MGPEGWTCEPGRGVVPDPIFGAKRLHEIYTRADPGYSGRVTVPVLWDREAETIVSNESADIIRMLNSAFDVCSTRDVDTCPVALRDEIDAINADVYENVNNGVYKAGFAEAQSAYDEAFEALFACLDRLEARLAERRSLVGDRPTEADWRLFTTLVRFDPVYHGHFKCNRNRLVDFPRLWDYTRDLYRQPGVAETVDLFHIQHHYYESHGSLNPTGIVPKGPAIDFAARDAATRSD
jgi:putative glutathione S-transferase